MTCVDFQQTSASVMPSLATPTLASPTLALPPLASQPVNEPVVIGCERSGEAAARERLLDRAFGPGRFQKTCELFRAGRKPAEGLSLVARQHAPSSRDRLVGTVRLWHVVAGETPALVLGPLAVDERVRSQGIGARLMVEAMDRARALGHGAILLVGDAPYYHRFGFDAGSTRSLTLPGPYDVRRFLACELVEGALDGAEGLVRPSGAILLRRPVARTTRRAA